MASITIRNLDDDVKTRLRVRAADNGRSMEEEARLILRDVVGRKPSSRNLTTIIRSHFGPTNGVDLELPPRECPQASPAPRPNAGRPRCRAARDGDADYRIFSGDPTSLTILWELL